MAESVDLLVVGGGINGVGVARDAAGRGLSVVLCEKDDLGEGTSSRSGKYIHGGLRYLEYYEFRLVREALIEREVVLSIAPHLTKPLRLILPHSPEQRPRWLVRLGLFLYDHLGGRKRIPASQAIDLARGPEGESVRSAYRKAFAYWDVWVDDARLVIANALDAAERGARVLTRTRCVSARREGDAWTARLVDARGREETVRARAIVNAAGPWVEQVLGQVAGVNSSRRVRLVKGSHVIAKRWWKGEHGYVLQAPDKRLIFVNPYFDDLALIGTTDIPYDDAPEEVAADQDEIDYLFGVLSRYFDRPFEREMALSTFSGVRPLYDDDSAKNASAVTRDYLLEVDGGGDVPPILSAFGGKITTYRKLAEHALDKLAPRFPEMKGRWTADAPLAGGDIPNGDFDRWRAAFRAERPWLPESAADHLARCYGSKAPELLAGCGGVEDLGRHFGGDFYEVEARWLAEREWARSADDVLWRRTKHGLFLSAEQRAAFAEWMASEASST